MATSWLILFRSNDLSTQGFNGLHWVSAIHSSQNSVKTLLVCVCVRVCCCRLALCAFVVVVVVVPFGTGARTHYPHQSSLPARLPAPGPLVPYPGHAQASPRLLWPVIYGLVSLPSGRCGHSEHLVFLLGGYFISLCNPHRRKPVTHFQPDTSVETGSKQRWGTKQSHCSLSRESWAGF